MEEADAAWALALLAGIIVRELVDEPESVRITGAWRGQKFVALKVSVDREDFGYVIGRQGRTARSLRTVLEAAARRRGVSCEVNIHGQDEEAG
jgi:hypothetical protein